MSSQKNLSQTERAVLGLRGMIVQGVIKPGERVIEQMVVDHCGVSRTPARAAMQRICEEGFITRKPQSGYVVSSFGRQDIFDAITIRGTLEGMAARLAAEKRVSKSRLDAMYALLAELDEVLAEPDVSKRQEEYAVLNDSLHDAICDAAQSRMLTRALERLTTIPFAMNNSFTDVPPRLEPPVAAILQSAQEQHYRIVEAIGQGEGARAEALTLEHSRSTWRYLALMLEESDEKGEPDAYSAVLATIMPEV